MMCPAAAGTESSNLHDLPSTSGPLATHGARYPVDASRTWLLSGIPRSGTSLCCRLADELPNFVALSEPIGRDVSGAASDARVGCEVILRSANRIRSQALAEGRVPTVNVDGRLDDNSDAPAISDSGLRKLRGERGDVPVANDLTAEFTLLIKHNALFAALLQPLTAKFPCLAIIRNPLAVLASWQTVDLPVARGRLPAGEQFDGGLRADVNAEPHVLRRQVIILNWFFEQYRRHLSDARIIRYEQLVSSGGLVLYRALGHARPPVAGLRNRNASALYHKRDVNLLLSALLDAGGAWLHFYDRSDCTDLGSKIRNGWSAV